MNRLQAIVLALAALGAAAVVRAAPAARGSNGDLCQCRPLSNPKIVGGSVVGDDVTYPWMASIGGLTSDIYPDVMKQAAKTPEDAKRIAHVCGAIILNKDYVLTTARCARSVDMLALLKPGLNISSFGVGFGKSLDAIYDAGRIPIAEVHVHPNYANQVMEDLEKNPIMKHISILLGNFEYDFSILKLSRSLQLSPEHGLLPACLETVDTSYYYDPLSTIGYGAMVNKVDLVSMISNSNFDKLSIMAGNELKKLNMQNLFINGSNPWFANALSEMKKMLNNPTLGALGIDLSSFSEQRMQSWQEMLWASAASDEPAPAAICAGDAGDPLMFKQGGITKVVGIASDIMSRMDGMISVICDDRAFYAKIAKALPWIGEIVHDDLCLA